MAAKGLKAKVLFYQKEYVAAANLIDEVLAESSVGLETDYAQIFSKRTRSREVLFASYAKGSLRENSTAYNPWQSGFSVLTVNLSPAYLGWLAGDPRAETAIKRDHTYGSEQLINGKFAAESSDTEKSVLFLRLAELYLIQAEAWTRSGNMTAGQAALNRVRTRAGLFPDFSPTADLLLAAIRMEKIKELGTETGSTWLDMVRYAVLDGLDLSSIKSSLNSPHQYILPIPQSSVARGVVVQNPGY